MLHAKFETLLEKYMFLVYFLLQTAICPCWCFGLTWLIDKCDEL